MATRVRFAPSPTGALHLGGLRTALYNYLLARSAPGGTGKFLLRIEDTDRSRFVPGATEALIEGLQWAGLQFDEGPGKPSAKYGPFVQSQRLDRYRAAADDLVRTGHAYRCYCTPERLAASNAAAVAAGKPPGYDSHCRHLPDAAHDGARRGESYVVRFKSATAGTTVFHDTAFKRVAVENATLDDFVLLKSDGWPTYHLASVVDDHHMDISHVMRGHEWLPSTPKHVQLYAAFGWTPPVWVHLPLLLNTERKKLSKRDGNDGMGSFVDRFRADGYHPEALLNFVGLLGWSPRTSKEIFTLDEMTGEFDLKRLHVSPAVVHFDRLDWLQKAHFAQLVKKHDPALVADLRTRIPEPVAKGVSDAYLQDVLGLISTRLHRVPEIVSKSPYFWSDPDFSVPGTESSDLLASIPHLAKLARATLDAVSTSYPTTADAWTGVIADLAKAVGVSKNVAMLALRCMATGTRVGAGLPDTLVLLGKETVVRRVAKHVDGV
ncbi:Glutamate--tRNA ligase mitochondrial [Blastocladiella emersonii ATCC 22665]|nr:Glutamate--tRNA ligase mitochondrial [Blastocladiella emersonii ATCC 22665]